MKKTLLWMLVALCLLAGLAQAEEAMEDLIVPEMGLSMAITEERLTALMGNYILMPDVWETGEEGVLYGHIGAYWASEDALNSLVTMEDVYTQATLVYELMVVREELIEDYGLSGEEAYAQADGYAFYCLSHAVDNPEEDFTLALMLADAADPLAWIAVSAPTIPEYEEAVAGEVGVVALAGVVDLYDQAIDADLYSKSKLTMVNIWATFCSPCIDEMPHLAEISHEYDPAQFQIIGIVTDVLDNLTLKPNAANMDLAKRIVEQTGADYPHLVPNLDMMSGPLAAMQYVPTTLFVDAQGNQVGEAVIGSRSKDQWIQVIEEHLLLVD